MHDCKLLLSLGKQPIRNFCTLCITRHWDPQNRWVQGQLNVHHLTGPIIYNHHPLVVFYHLKHPWTHMYIYIYNICIYIYNIYIYIYITHIYITHLYSLVRHTSRLSRMLYPHFPNNLVVLKITKTDMVRTKQYWKKNVSHV